MVVRFHIIDLKTCMLGFALWLCSILSFNRDKSYLDGRLVLVLNLHYGAITPQFHVVFDDLFSTVPSIGGESEDLEVKLPNHWEQLCLENSTSIPFENSSKPLQDDWLSAEERVLKYRTRQKKLKIQEKISLDTSELNNPERGHKSNSKLKLTQNSNKS